MRPSPPPAERPLQVGQRRTVTTVWPATTPPPAEDRKRLALVLVPHLAGEPVRLKHPLTTHCGH